MPIKKDIRIQIEDFFDYYWQNDRSRTLKCTEDKKILDELQDTFVQQIMIDYLYADFLYIFKNHFANEYDN